MSVEESETVVPVALVKEVSPKELLHEGIVGWMASVDRVWNRQSCNGPCISHDSATMREVAQDPQTSPLVQQGVKIRIVGRSQICRDLRPVGTRSGISSRALGGAIEEGRHHGVGQD